MHTPSRRDLLAGVAGLTAAVLVPRPGLHAAEPDDRFYRDNLDQPIDLGVTPIEIRSAPASALSLAPIESGGTTARFHNLQHNARMGGGLAAGPWRVRWSKSVMLLNQHGAILNTSGRILVHDWAHWKLFDTAGGSVSGGSMGDGEVHLDPAHAMFHLWSPSGAIEARRLTDGEQAFVLPPSLLGSMSRVTFLSRVGRRLVVAGSDTPIHDALDRNLSCIHVHDLGDPPQVDTRYQLHPPGPAVRLVRKSPTLWVAWSDERLFLASPRWFYRTDLDLNIGAAWTADVEPLGMSVDEGGRVYALVRASDQRALWVLSPQGELIVWFDLPEEVRYILGPPAVGYDHRVYVVAFDRVIAVGHDGKQAYNVAVQGGIAGWGVTSDHQLLLSNGPNLVALDARGRSTVLHTFDASLATAPVLTSRGDLLVATARMLYCLIPDA